MDKDKKGFAGRRFRRFRSIALLVLTVFGASGMLALAGRSGGPEPGKTRALYTVQPGPLTISVLEAGTVSARDQVVIKNEVEGSTSILWLVEEGIQVEKGELLLELDASELQNQLVERQIRVQNSEAAFIRARENLDVTKNQAQSDQEKADLELRFAREDLKKYTEGDYPQQLKQAEARIAMAREELERAREKLKWSEVLFAEKYISQTELQADQLAAKKTALDLELAEGDLHLLKSYTHQRQLAELESAVKQAGMAQARTERRGRANVVQAEAELRARAAEFEREKSKLAKVGEQIEKTEIRAPAAGLVIYATTARGGWRGNAEPLAAGQQVKERQELIYLPKTSSMQVEVKLHESSLSKVRPGLPVVVTADALPERRFTGRIASVSPLPDAASMWLNPDLKVYATIIHLDGETSGLRTGMSCRAEILVEQFAEVVYVPLQAVLRIDRQPTVWVREPDGFSRRAVETGLENSRMIQIVQGLRPGEKVLLTPPLAAGEAGEPAVADRELQSS